MPYAVRLCSLTCAMTAVTHAKKMPKAAIAAP